ncbi:cullin-associated NEDD8-dissociated protein 1 isoform X2 [Selaginella moellendorffii]|uniref:cullin-associated NEDD8-dissociated protein 1 isoform X2 n=1 Tax=Selaginella moellendorffii TaxID=88036 RepID=UPI000D1C24AE|nr:cullin-associated NEDD8-dissociated protein 1 isoform X2 [Selaginella moellendorffii]XP_024542023.1 cullin-associated NEDD8-dissociated protein 1 isoform X2 [Selaginella moellendorffii]|eukprot:XP_024525263.1 cullin-associated NEDD8-dissociated protein 1 isoform X2 [Selaginella moellendorffii]
MANLTVGLILEKIASKDKDYRYMATSDLLNELQKESFKADSETERKVSQIVLQQLDDASGDISGIAVKCLGPLVKKVNENKIVEIVESLCTRLLTGKDHQRDIASIALKTVVSEIASGTVAQCVVAALTPKLIKGITATDTSTEVKSECLDILCDVLHRFGALLVPEHEKLLNALLVQLNLQRAGLRKRAIQCLATLAACMSDDLLGRATVSVVDLLKNKDVKPDMTRTNIQMICAFCRAVGYRFGPHLNEVVPLLISYCQNASENDDELRENSLQALESFVLRCPRDVAEHCGTILDLALEYLSYDPNFTDDMEEDQDEDMDGEEEDDEESADEYSDDEDVSWKVRRAAAKCLSAVISSRPEMLSTLYSKACPRLIDRFREREENVKIDVFNAFIDLLRQTGNVTKASSEINPSSPLYMLQQEVPKVVRTLNRQLREKSVKTRVGAFSVLKELVVVLPNCLSDHMASLLPGVEKALNDKSSNSNLKIEALTFTRLVMPSHSPSVFHPHIQALSGPVLAAVNERYYKVTAEALRVCGELVKAIRPDQGSTFNFVPYVQPIYGAILKRLTAQDQDQEVKECAIFCMGLVVSILGDKLERELPVSLSLLLDRLRNEITRLTAVKAFATIAESPLKINLNAVLEQVIAELTTFLRKANRALRQASLGTLNALLVSYGDKIGNASYDSIITELSALISDADLHMAALALELCCTMMADKKHHISAGNAVREKVLPQALVLVRSSLLQGQALQTLQTFFASLVQSASTFDMLLEALLSSAKNSSSMGGPASKQAFHSVAQCAAVLCLAAGDAKCLSTVAMLVNGLKTGGHDALLSLLCLGEIGRRKDLSSVPDIESVIIRSFQSPSEEIKSAASYALGNVAVGNLSKYLPFILGQIDRQSKLQYLLLHSLKEVIARQSSDEAGKIELQDADVQKILSLLFNYCESEEEGVRNVVAECLGKLALIEPERLVPALKARTSSTSAFTRATVVIAIKYTIVERPQPIDGHIKLCISSFLMLIKDGDRHVRRAAVSALSTAGHNKPSLVKELLPVLFPLLYEQTVVKKELIRTVDLGPFKHTVDDGLELRKGAFECVDTLLDSCLDQIDPSAFLTYLLSGLSDHYDVKMPCHLILSKLAEKCPSAVIAVLDVLVEPLEKTVTNKTKPDAVKQEVDRNEDMIRSALRAIDSLDRISGESSPRFRAFINNVVKSGTLAEKYNAVRHESDTVVAGDVMDMS